MPYISVVTPVYNAVNIVEELYRQIVENVSRITNDFEIIMVNDCCPYGSGEKIAEIARHDNRVKFIDLSRNFGQHIAISAGLDYAEGDYVVVMDCDLQDPPNKIPVLLDELKKSGKEIIFAVREKRKESFLKLFYSHMFRCFMALMTDKIFRCDKDIGNFSIISRKVVMAIRKFKEINRNYASLVFLSGFEKTFISIESQKRYEGKSGYTFLKSLKHAFHILLQQSVKPLYISVVFLIVTFFCSCGFGAWILYNHFKGTYDVEGWASIMFAITFCSSLIFLVLSVMSLYIANIFTEGHLRPLYIITRTINTEEK